MFSPFENKDEADYPCPHHGTRSAVKFSFNEVMTIEEAKNLDKVHDVDLDTFMRVNDLNDETELRVYSCNECSGIIMYFPDSGCQYVA